MLYVCPKHLQILCFYRRGLQRINHSAFWSFFQSVLVKIGLLVLLMHIVFIICGYSLNFVHQHQFISAVLFFVWCVLFLFPILLVMKACFSPANNIGAQPVHSFVLFGVFCFRYVSLLPWLSQQVIRCIFVRSIVSVLRSLPKAVSLSIKRTITPTNINLRFRH